MTVARDVSGVLVSPEGIGPRHLVTILQVHGNIVRKHGGNPGRDREVGLGDVAAEAHHRIVLALGHLTPGGAASNLTAALTELYNAAALILTACDRLDLEVEDRYEAMRREHEEARAMTESACRVCGCTWDDACDGGCWWAVEPGAEPAGPLCSSCEHFPSACFAAIGASVIGLPVERFTHAASLREDLGMDNLQLIELAMTIEAELPSPVIDDEAIGDCVTWGDLCAAVRDAMPEAVVDAP